jgi:putative intracellular protease/amidase
LKILSIITSHGQLGKTGMKTGFWLEELASPYYVFMNAGAHITLTSPNGGHPPVDPKSLEPQFQTQATARFNNDQAAKQSLAGTLKLSEINPDHYDAVFYPGGHGPLWDLAENASSIELINHFFARSKPIAAVCHAPCVLRHAITMAGEPLVKGKHVTGFSNSEENAVQLSQAVPYLLEDELKRLGGIYSKADDWQSYAICDSNLITGQNPASSERVAQLLIQLLQR